MTKPEADGNVVNFPQKGAAVKDDGEMKDLMALLLPEQNANRPSMSTPTREEFESRLETLEARMDARVVRIEGKIDAFMGVAQERDKRMDLLLARATEASERAGDLKGHMWAGVLTVLVAVIGTVVASYFANQQSNIGIAQAVTSAYQQGQSSPPKTK